MTSLRPQSCRLLYALDEKKDADHASFVPLKSASSNASFGSRTALSLNGFQALVNGLKFDQTFALDLLG